MTSPLRVRSQCRLFISLFVMVTLGACQGESVEDGTDNATACAESDLIAQCPPNSFPDLESNAMIACSLDGSIDASQSEGSFDGEAGIDTACFGAGACRVICRLEVPCENGVERISPTDGIICAQALSCTPDSRRCDGPLVQVCSLRGQWDTIECPTDQTCQYNPMGEGYCVDASGGTAGDTAGDDAGDAAGDAAGEVAGDTAGDAAGDAAGGEDSDPNFCEMSCFQLFEQCVSGSEWCPTPRPVIFRSVCRSGCEMDDTLMREFINGEHTCASMAEALGINEEETPAYCQAEEGN